MVACFRWSVTMRLESTLSCKRQVLRLRQAVPELSPTAVAGDLKVRWEKAVGHHSAFPRTLRVLAYVGLTLAAIAR